MSQVINTQEGQLEGRRLLERPRLAFLNRCYWPDIEATGQLLEELAVHLTPNYDVTVVAGQPNCRRAGETFLRRGREVRQGVTIERLNHTTFHKKTIAGRLVNLSSFTWKAYLWGRKAPRYDVVISETDPFFLPLVAAPLAKRMGAKYIAYMQDIYPDIGIALGIKRESTATRALRRRLLAAYQFADRIVVLDEDMRDRLCSWGLPWEKFDIIPNWVDTQVVRPVKSNNRVRALYGLDDRFVVMHSGNMGLTQRLDILVQAAADPAWPQEAILLLVGGGARQAELQAQATRLGVTDRVRFLPYQPLEQLGESLSAADLQVVSMDPSIAGLMSPSKIYGIFASGTATLGLVPPGGSVDCLIRGERVGYSVPAGDASGFVTQIRHAMQNRQHLAQFGRAARSLAESRFDKQISCAAFEELLNRLLVKSDSCRNCCESSEVFIRPPTGIRPAVHLTER